MSSIGDKPIQTQAIVQDKQLGTEGVPAGKLEEAAKHAAANVSGTVKTPNDNFVRDTAALSIDKQGPAVPPPGLPPVNPSADEAEGARVLADNYDDAMGPAINSKSDDIAKLSTDMLMKFFMMLNILDPNNSRENQKNLAELKTNLRQQAITAVKKEIANLKDRIAKAEKSAKMWGFISNILTMLNPLGMISKMAGDNSTLATIGGVLAPEQMLVQMFGEGKAKTELETLKTELKGAEGRLAKVEYYISQMGPDRRKKLEREQQEAVDEMKAETANVGVDGVPIKGIAKSLKGELGKAMQALQALGAAEGPQAMMAAAPGAFREAVLPLFTELNLKNAEARGEEMVELLVQQLAQGTLGTTQPNPVIGPMTTMLAEKLDPDSKHDVDLTPGDAFRAAHADVMQMLRDWAASQTGATRNVTIQG